MSARISLPTRIIALLAAMLLALAAYGAGAGAQENAEPPAGDSPADHILLTVYLKHDQSKTIDEILAQLESTGFWQAFPPEGVEVLSWNVVMGIGQVVTLKVPPEKLRAVNVTIEKTAWKAFRTEFYATYDLWPIVQKLKTGGSE